MSYSEICVTFLKFRCHIGLERDKIFDKIRSAEGTDPMFFMYLVLVVLVVQPILIDDTTTDDTTSH